MKKVLLGLLVVLSVLICFVGCKEVEINSVSFSHDYGGTDGIYTFVINRDNSGKVEINGSEHPFTSLKYKDGEDGLYVTYNKDSHECSQKFYKTYDPNTDIENFDDLLKLTSVFDYNGKEYTKD